MAGKSCLLFLTLICLSVFASAHRLLVVDKHVAATPSIDPKTEIGVKKTSEHMKKIDIIGTGKVRTTGNKENIGDIGSKMLKNDEKREKIDGIMNRNGNNGEETRKIDDIGNKMVQNGEEKEQTNGNMRLKPEELAAGLYTVVPVPNPDVDGGFHFQLGPIGFGGSWQWGGSTPVYVIPYSQPYVVVSPYGPPGQYMGPYQQPTAGFGLPPQQGSDEPLNPGSGGSASPITGY